MKVGDYVRTPYGIRKVKEIRIKDNYLDDGFYVEDKYIVCGHKAMQKVKSSPNIIDLIEVGDYDRYMGTSLFTNLFSKERTNCFINDEVEVIEEDKNDNFTGMRVYQDGKEIYAIDDSGNFTCKDDEKDKTIETINWKSCADNLNDVNDNIDDLVNKINEIIDKLNKGE